MRVKQFVAISLVLIMTFGYTSIFAESVSPAQKPEVYAGGLVYSGWYGDGEGDWSTDFVGTAKNMTALATFIATGIACGATQTGNAPAAGLAQWIAFACAGVAILPEMDYVYGTIEKAYREVTYSDGSFAYFETRFVCESYLVKIDGEEIPLGSETYTMKGNSPLRIGVA